MRVFQAANYDNLSQIPEKNGVLTLIVVNMDKNVKKFQSLNNCKTLSLIGQRTPKLVYRIVMNDILSSLIQIKTDINELFVNMLNNFGKET